MTTVLLLGGTADARQLTSRLHHYFSQHGENRIPRIIYSVAGLVRTPSVPCDVFVGGFSAVGGLEAYSQAHQVDMIIDVTHPYAEKMTHTAMKVAEKLQINYVRFHRPEWQPSVGDQWTIVPQWEDVLEAVKTCASLFLTAGQLTQRQVDGLHEQNKQQRQLLRTAVKPTVTLPPTMQWTKAIGPFSVESEGALFQQHAFDGVVSKNSGGEATAAKLTVARKNNIPVVMLARPTLVIPKLFRQVVFDNMMACEQAIIYMLSAIEKIPNQVRHDDGGDK